MSKWNPQLGPPRLKYWNYFGVVFGEGEMRGLYCTVNVLNWRFPCAPSAAIALKGLIVSFLGLFSEQLFSMRGYSWSSVE